MKKKLHQMGNSVGLILDRTLLDQIGTNPQGEVDLHVEDGSLVVRAATSLANDVSLDPAGDDQVAHEIWRRVYPQDSRRSEDYTLIRDALTRGRKLRQTEICGWLRATGDARLTKLAGMIEANDMTKKKLRDR